MGRGADRHRRCHARRLRGAGPGVRDHADDAGAGRRRRPVVCLGHRLADDRRQRRVPGLEPRLLHHLGQVQPGCFRRRLVPGGSDHRLGQQPGLLGDSVVSLRAGVPLQRRRGRHHRPGLQPVRDPRRLPRAGADRHRRRTGAGDVPRHRRREPLRRALCPRTDGPFAARAQGYGAIPARQRVPPRRARRPVLLARLQVGPGCPRAAGHTRLRRCRARAGGEPADTAPRRHGGRRRAGVRAAAPAAR